MPTHLYHPAKANNWPLIHRFGLLTARRLLGKSGLSKELREQFKLQQRLTHIVLPGGFEIRDQLRMSANALERCLVGLTPTDWYRLLTCRSEESLTAPVKEAAFPYP